tara:strand:+ start:328 stop:447 length:120 start_codon:yes stop_codon:yes gene_type:complete
MIGLFFLGMIVTIIFFMILFRVMEWEKKQMEENEEDQRY